MDFYSKIQDVLDEYTLTENGAVAYKSTNNKLLDFNFQVSQFRDVDEKEIEKRFAQVYEEDRTYAILFLFCLRDCRGGLGERRTFRVCLRWLADKEPELVSSKEFMFLIPFYGRWDDVVELIDTPLVRETADFIKEQIHQDLSNGEQGKPFSLLGKWLPSENASSRRTRDLARSLQYLMGYSPRIYRKILSTLRGRIKIVEAQMSAGEWGEIDYSTVPSKANLIYKNAFMRHDPERRLEYLESLKKGESKINASVLNPHEIVRSYGSFLRYSRRLPSYNETLEELWKSLPDLTVENTLVVRDGSFSMMAGASEVVPLDVATALSIYLAEKNSGIWKDKFITFSKNPKIVDLTGLDSLHSKLDRVYGEDDCTNTDIERIMLLVLSVAVEGNYPQEEMPGRILIISDMGFDAVKGRCSNCQLETLFENIQCAYEEQGYKMPKIVFWNVAANMDNGIPLRENELGVILCSGFSVQLLQMVMSSETDPLKALLNILDSDRYEPVKSVLNSIT